MTEWRDGEGLRLRRLAASDLDQLLIWRNDPAVRRWMIDDRPIAPAQHQRWWLGLRDDPARLCLLLERESDAEVVAVVQFYHLGGETPLDGWWGFYLTSPERRPADQRLALWLRVESLVVDYGHNRLGLQRLWCESLSDNQPVLALHRRSGFVERERRSVERGAGEATLVVMVHEQAPAAQAQTALERGQGQRARGVVVGSANWSPLLTALADGPLQWSLPPFGQWPILLAAGDPLLTDADWLLCCERLEDLLDDPTAVIAAGSEQTLIAGLDRYIERLQLARQRCRGRMVVCDLVAVRPLVDELDHAAAVARIVERLNRRLATAIGRLSDCHLLACSSLVARYGSRFADPGGYWLLGRIPYHQRFMRPFAEWIGSAILAWREQTVRLVVVDLDNTLWGGVVGEVGLDGIALGRDHPGNGHRTLQQWLLRLRQRGVALAIASRNSEALALEAIASHPEMVLRPEHFASHEIGWGAKSASISRIADRVGLSPASLLFIDDSPYERAEVRAALPQVVVPELPDDIALWPAALEALPGLVTLASGESDRQRADRYHQQGQRHQAEMASESRESFLRDLGMVIDLKRVTSAERQRVMQLIERTNQFNATTRRHSRQRLATMVEQGGELLAIGLMDRFSSRELVGVVMMLYPEPGEALIETLLLSCRVLGRDVETATLALIARHLRRRGGVERLLGEICHTPRNQPVRDLYRRHGFQSLGNGAGEGECERWLLELTADRLPLPEWFRLPEAGE